MFANLPSWNHLDCAPFCFYFKCWAATEANGSPVHFY
uniref:Uncharacterized protein n=1 Tax=Arundo donax TaxID=35708 RepID=A0A0A9GDN7_ARUDO